MIEFPQHQDSSAAAKISDLERLMDRTLTNSQYVDGLNAARLLGTFIRSYRSIMGDAEQAASRAELTEAHDEAKLFGLMLSAGFDLICNAEYIHGRMVNSKWIYCHREDEPAVAYYSFLKQCPKCCLDRGLESRLSGAQHKPTSHHIGEITTVAIALLLQLVAAANENPFEIATITKQSHDVDAIGFRDDLLVLFEIKASPMVSFPLVTELAEPMLQEGPEGPTEYRQHSLVDLTLQGREFALSIPHGPLTIPLGERNQASWPYQPLIDYFSVPSNAARYLRAWIELYAAYRTPKTQREGRTAALAYLVNGWGDEIDSNKTKPGLGRTDDIKKGTYQLLKFGSYYRDDAARVAVRGALVANLDPLFLRAGYIDGLSDVRWGHGRDFTLEDGQYRIAEDSLRHLYDAIVAFNDPVLNDPLLQDVFDLAAVERKLADGGLEGLLDDWIEQPEVALDAG